MKEILKLYENSIKYPSRNLDEKKRILIVNKQLKKLRDTLCKQSGSFDELLQAQYAYVVTTLNVRNRIWKYGNDTMSFQRRVGEMWESFVKGAFYSSPKTRLVDFPQFEDVKNIFTNVPDEFLNLIGKVNLKTDSLFVSNRRLNVVDLKYGFNSNEKGNMQRLHTVGSVYKLWKPKIKLFILVRETDNNEMYLEKLSEVWDVKKGDAAYQVIENLTGYDLRNWIDNNIRFERHLDKDLYSNIKKKNLKMYLQW